jgi:hypothetical protein
MGFGDGKKVDAKLYLEGRLIENGFVRATITGGVNAPAAAEIRLVPTRAIKHILPMTEVHLFATDPWAPEPADRNEDPFKLIFSGQVVGRGFIREHNARAFIIHCLDFSHNWTGPRKWWFDLTAPNGQMTSNILRLVTGNNFDGSRVEPNAYDVMTQPYAIRRVGNNDSDRFTDALVALLDDVGLVTPFYHLVRNRYRITDRVLTKPAGDVRKLFEMDRMLPWIEGLMGKASGEKSLLAMVLELLDTIYHEYVALPVPSLIQGPTPQRDKYGNPILDDLGLLQPRIDETTHEILKEPVVAQFLFKPNCYTLSPPTCNVLYPNQYDRVEFLENYLADPTRLVMRPTFPAKLGGELASVMTQVLRPTDLELFFNLLRQAPERTGRIPYDQRTADATLESEGARGRLSPQAPKFTDFDYYTNEERFRGIVYNIMPLTPAATMFGLQAGVTDADGGPVAFKGGLSQFSQGVASYEFFKEKFKHRTIQTQGPFNPRAVPGFSALLLDDSDEHMTTVGYLSQITHVLDAAGSGSTSYVVGYARLLDEVDLNRPQFKVAGDIEAGFTVETPTSGDITDMFGYLAHPPIPQWFSDDWKTLVGLDFTYQDLLGVHVLEQRFFSTVSSDKERNAFTLDDAVEAMVDEYTKARKSGDEFSIPSVKAARPLVDRDAAFRFIGAVDEDLIDQRTGTEVRSAVGAARRRAKYRGVTLARYPTGGARLFAFAEADSNVVINKPDAPQFPAADTLSLPSQAEGPAELSTASILTDNPIYEGRPAPFNFEYRIFWESFQKAATSLASSGIAFNTEDGKKKLEAALQRLVDGDLAQTPENRAPTGTDSAKTDKTPGSTPVLAVPLAERDIIQMRRAIVDAYIAELQGQRGFRG